MFNNLVECRYTNDYIFKYAKESDSLDNDKEELPKTVNSMQNLSSISLWVG